MKNINDLLQYSLPLISEIPKPRYLDDALVTDCQDYGAAVRLCIGERIRRMSEAEIAECLGFKPPHLSKVKQGRGYLTADQEVILQYLCSNWSIRQYQEMRADQMAELTESPADKIVRLERQIQDMKGRRAA